MKRPVYKPQNPSLPSYPLTQPCPTRPAYLTHPGSYNGPSPDMLPTEVVTVSLRK